MHFLMLQKGNMSGKVKVVYGDVRGGSERSKRVGNIVSDDFKDVL